MSADKKPKNAKSPEGASLEDALARLESVVDSMESGDIPLDQLVARYEEGMKLLKLCEEQLRAAELRIEELSSDEDSKA
jgi:exodeoxyribonuclease VII small subunit